MKVSEVSKRYAKALLAAAKEKGNQVLVNGELEIVVKSIQADSTVKSFFENPTISTEQKVNALKKALETQKVSQELTNALVLLADKSRLNILPELAVAYRDLLDLENGVTRGVVKSATPLSDEAKAQLEQKITKVLNKKLVLSYEQDPKVLGGVIASVGGWTFDDTVNTHLKKLNEELNRRAN